MPEPEPTEPITITVPGTGEPEPSPTPEPTPAPADESPEAAFAQIKKQLEESTAATRRAEERADREAAARQEEARRRVTAENQSRVSSTRADEESAIAREREYDSVVNALAAAESTAKQLASQKAALMAEGKWDEASVLDVQIAEVGGDLSGLKRGKAQLEEARKTAPKPEPRTAEVQKTQAQINEEWTSQLPVRSAAWIRDHADKFFGDQRFQEKVMAAANNAEKVLGLTYDSDDYFKHIEEAVGLRQKETPVAAAEPEPKPEPKPAPKPAPVARTSPAPAAPPSRTTPSARPGVDTPVTLTAEERAIARATMTPEVIGKNPDGTPRDPEVVYAQRKLEIQREHGGRMPVWTPQGRA